MQNKQFGVPKMWIFYLVGVALVIVGIVISTPAPTHDPLIENEEVRELYGRELSYHESVELHGDGVFVEDQSYGAEFVMLSGVTIESEGSVVIYDDATGEPGEKIGKSDLLSGEYEKVVIDLREPLIMGGVYYAMLVDGEGEFVVTDSGVVVMMSFAAGE
jgi:hypothetical protein